MFHGQAALRAVRYEIRYQIGVKPPPVRRPASSAYETQRARLRRPRDLNLWDDAVAHVRPHLGKERAGVLMAERFNLRSRHLRFLEHFLE